ncbi:uracil-DNA glycosylase [Candidatus Bathyarchaeota archaeon]|nr:uracil-DNA glycosylase [Candidatus Bathyarchaeota archaeon]MDP6048920.1 uracil-DNA glycosylase [Candidatus Bathyarchaeota archaeon]
MSYITDAARTCERCCLHKGRLNVVPGEGSLCSSVVLIGEAPGRKEDESGRPFIGSAGKILDEAMENAGLARSQVYITNVVKCRPPGNRRPRLDEVAACTNYLYDQLAILTPQVIAPMGNSALYHVFNHFGFGNATIGEVHGKPHLLDFVWGKGVVFPLYHPAAILYNRTLKNDLHADFEALGDLLGPVSL